MRLVTWNINGLRAIIRRKFGSLKALLDSLDAGQLSQKAHTQIFSLAAKGLSFCSENFCVADIICFQETKLTKTDFDRNIALCEGWYGAIIMHVSMLSRHKHSCNCRDPQIPMKSLSLVPIVPLMALCKCRQSFFTFYRNKSRGYSGVATFCRAGVAVPVAAQEGFTGKNC